MTSIINIHAFRQSAINDHPFSTSFKKRCGELHLSSMEQLLAIPSEKSVTEAYLGISHFRELVDYLSELKLLYLFK